MEPEERQDLTEAVLNLKFAQDRTDRALAELQALARPLAVKHSPRSRFERWRDSSDGKHWKRAQHRKQRGRCACCQAPIDLNGSHIDHIQPLARAPELACDSGNLQILCADCNYRKGDRAGAGRSS
ncbi:MAG: HNH endonuclease signature motif containing protein [Geitlerinemataceae cyanobacterium]